QRVAMAALRSALSDAGFGGVRTHLQSGNVVLDSDLASAELGPAIQGVLADRLDLHTDVLVRSPAELAAAADADPFGDVASNPSRHVLGFLASEPDPERVAIIEQRIASLPSDGDRHAWGDRHFYLWCPNGISTSPYFK